MEEDGQRVQDAAHHEHDRCTEQRLQVEGRGWQASIGREDADTGQQIGGLTGDGHGWAVVVMIGDGAVGIGSGGGDSMGVSANKPAHDLPVRTVVRYVRRCLSFSFF